MSQGKRLGYLTCNPLRRRGGVVTLIPDEISAMEPYNHEAVEHSEANGRDDEQIHGGNVRRVGFRRKGPAPPGWVVLGA